MVDIAVLGCGMVGKIIPPVTRQAGAEITAVFGIDKQEADGLVKLLHLEGNDVSISDFQGKKVFLNFWATWCPSCKVEMPEMERVWKENSEEVVVVAVDIGESRNTVKSYIEEGGYTFKVLLDEDKIIAQKFGITAIPTSILLDENGNLIYGVRGAMTYENMSKFVKEELKKSN